MASEVLSFERPHHRRIAQVLAALDAASLRAAHCLFGGGTAMALRFGETHGLLCPTSKMPEICG